LVSVVVSVVVSVHIADWRAPVRIRTRYRPSRTAVKSTTSSLRCASVQSAALPWNRLWRPGRSPDPFRLRKKV